MLSEEGFTFVWINEYKMQLLCYLKCILIIIVKFLLIETDINFIIIFIERVYKQSITIIIYN